ncbi:MAG: glycosyltransferase [Chloroflexi bacterium]|nr:glycosyltransferase [Chloroflexota bacterium]
MRFTIVTPCYNAEQYISETMRSVLEQTALRTGRSSLQYIIADGGSKDGTVGIAEECAKKSGIDVEIISEPDRGMYDALVKGLKRATGDVCAYLNAGDLYSTCAFDILEDVFAAHPVRWVTGMQIAYNESGHLVEARMPFRYRRRLIDCGLYYAPFLHYIQQESTFWHHDLNQYIDLEKLVTYRLAGDFFLWRTFAQHADLVIVKAHLGGFRVHHGQQSASIERYLAEFHSIARPPTPVDWMIGLFDKVARNSPARIRNRLNQGAILSYDHFTGTWQYQ